MPKNNQSLEASVQPQVREKKVKPPKPTMLKYKSPFIDQELCIAVADHTEKLKEHLNSLSDGETKIGSMLIVLKTHFETFYYTTS